MAAVDPADVTALLDDAPGNAATVVALVTTLARSYTRGNGFTPDGEGVEQPNDEIAAVITTASVRLAANSSQLPNAFTKAELTLDTRSGFAGWSVAELAVLNRYRVRAM